MTTTNNEAVLAEAGMAPAPAANLTETDDGDGLWLDADGQLAAAQAIFAARVMDADLSCSIYSATIENDDEHNCVGCNLQVRCERVHWFLTSGRENWEPDAAIETLIWQINALYECVRDICDLVDAPSWWRNDDRNFGGFVIVRAWANFFKHPGVVTHGIHHPLYSFEGTEAAAAAIRIVGKQTRTDKKAVVVDTELVKTEWTKETPDARRLSGATSAFVILPDLGVLTERVADNYEMFVNALVDNPIYTERIRSCSTRLCGDC